MNEYILTLDLGTQSARAIIFDKNGSILAKDKQEYHPTYIPSENGLCEQDPNVYFQYLVTATKNVVSKHPELVKNVKGVVATTFRDTAVFLDKDMKVLRPSILWLDQRISSYIPHLPVWKKVLFWIVGMTPVINANQQKTMAHWVKANEEDIWNKTYKYVNISTYVNYLITGKLKDTASNLTGHYPIDYKKGEYYKKNNIKYGVFDIPSRLNCEIVKPGDIIGYTNESFSKATGIPTGLPVYGAGSDKSCESLGNGCIDSSMASISYGTASTIAITSKKYVEPSAFLPAYPSIQKGFYNSELQIYRGYWMLNWFKDEFCANESLEAGIQNIATLDIMNQKMLSIGPGSEGLILQPYWGPSLERPNSRGAIIGFSEKHHKIHLYRAIIEGIAFCLREGKERIEKKGRFKIESLAVSGGGAISPAICQITADIFGLKVKRIHTFETSSLGAAMLGFISNGTYKDAEEAKKYMVHYETEFLPNDENHKKYNYLYKNVYVKLFPQLKRTYTTLREYTGEKL